MPTSEALQVFYGVIGGTLPLAGVILWAALGQRMLLQDILARLKSVETTLIAVVSRLSTLEARAGIVYHE